MITQPPLDRLFAVRWTQRPTSITEWVQFINSLLYAAKDDALAIALMDTVFSGNWLTKQLALQAWDVQSAGAFVAQLLQSVVDLHEEFDT